MIQMLRKAVLCMGWGLIALVLDAQSGAGHGEYYARLQPEIVEVGRHYPSGDARLSMDFAKARIHNPAALEGLDSIITQVDLVYTRYPADLETWEVGYDSLMERRFANLEKLLPQAFVTPNVQWRLILQTGCQSQVEAEKLFHGFEIYAGPLTHEEEEELPKPKQRFDSLNLKLTWKSALSLYEGETEFYDSTALNILAAHEEWKQKVLIIDWTASMYRHGAQVLHWLKEQNASDVLGVVFFNDGDGKWDDDKVVGETGGIYTVEGFAENDVLAAMEAVSWGGSGGDHRENDLEALLEAMDQFPEAEEFILLADNSGPVRDMELMSQIERPFRIILCGVYKDIFETDYLDLARRTNSTLHTLERDLTDLDAIGPMQLLELEQASYQRRKHGFRRVPE